MIGSGELVQTLFEHGLVDEFRLMLDRSWSAEGSVCSAMMVCSGRCGSSTAR